MDKETVTNVGVIYVGYNQYENIRHTLDFWNNITIPGYKFNVVVVSVPFKEYEGIEVIQDESLTFIQSILKCNVSRVITDPKFVIEPTARNLGLWELLKNFLSNGSLVWQVDSDEYYTLDQVKSILDYIEKTPESLCYKINFKNYIFDGKHYLSDFCVPKINRVKNMFMEFYNDNGIAYLDGSTLKSPIAHSIPKEVAYVRHMSWLHKNGKQKVEYQLKHFGACSYRWNESKGELELDLSYYSKHGYTVPTILKDE